MGKASKWGLERMNDNGHKTLRCVLFVSRNKDNRDVPDFKERRECFVHGFDDGSFENDLVQDRFDNFVKNGVPNEMSRLYVSVNSRDNGMIKKMLLEKLIFDDTVSMGSMDPILCSIAAKKECAAEKKWMFDVDFDASDARCLVDSWADDVVNDIARHGGFEIDDMDVHRTPHGRAVIVPHGFDCRKILEKWDGLVTLKRDDLLCMDWKQTSPEA